MTSNDKIEFTGVKGITLKQTWVCPHCGVTVIVYVEPYDSLTHPCPKQAGRNTPLTKKEETK